MSKKQKKVLVRIILAAVFFTGGIICRLCGANEFAFVLSIAAYLLCGYDVLLGAARGVASLCFWNEKFLMSVASVGAFLIGENVEGVAVMLLYQIGELFCSCAVGKSRKSIAALMDIKPISATVIRGGEQINVSPDEVKIGELITVKPGEKIPLDGSVVEGNSFLDTSALTGESVPREITVGENALAGTINLSSPLVIKAEKAFEDTTLQKILDLVENSAQNKAKTVDFITKFARFYTPAVMALAALIGLLVPAFVGDFSDWIRRALSFLVISCPCALVISVPLSYFGGIGAASKKGVLIKGSNHLESLASSAVVVFDKTGTLTTGELSVEKIHSEKISKQQLLALAAAAEKHSSHPLALSVVNAAASLDNPFVAENITEHHGMGVSGVVDGKELFVGSVRLLNKFGIECKIEATVSTAVFVALGGEYMGYITFSDTLKPTAAAAVKELKKLDVKNTVMLTGDRQSAALKIANELGLDKAYFELLPDGKVAVLEEIIKASKGTVAFMGDGINDAPVIMRADVGIAMGCMGSDAAIDAADIVIMDDNPLRLCTAIKIAKRTSLIVKQNITFALLIKVLFLGLGGFGITTMLGAVFADVGVMVLAVLNAMRTLKIK